MYTRADFGLKLKEWVRTKQDVADIGNWVYSIYLDHIEDIDREFRHILITLNYMEDGPEFALSYKRLDEIADDLIAGKKDINLDY
ncbi:hypothetical protein ACD661_08220 [Legionella lytica]|uniref:Uncharacterized protein n=1 Tax=Legionella lytica TaxID=96232 RepID=A0ABW8D763_9GAMM